MLGHNFDAAQVSHIDQIYTQGRKKKSQFYDCLTKLVKAKMIILVSCACYNKLPSTWWLKITEIFLLQIWRPEVQTGFTRLKPKCQSEDLHAFCKLEKDLFPRFFQLLELQIALCFLWLMTSSFILKVNRVASYFRIHTAFFFCLYGQASLL